MLPPVLIVPLWNWNFVEEAVIVKVLQVLIVPLWNWNLDVNDISAEEKRSNCTFMELKSQQTGSQTCDTNVLIVPLWNWNLRCRIGQGVSQYILIVPLWNWNKLRNKIEMTKENVQIVPLWNWNYIMIDVTVDLETFKLYLYGIEIVSLM